MISIKELDGHLKKLGNNDLSSFEEFYNETKSTIYAYSLSVLKNRDDALDVLQDAYIRILKNANKYKSDDKPLAWIITIVKNLCFTKISKRRDYVNIDDLSEILSNKSNNIDDRLFLSYLFEHVSDEERLIVLLHASSGYKHKEIADMLGLSLGTVLSKYNRVMKKLEEISKEDN